ncbi:MAG: PP2C family protein-serine/threonine phosphatase [Terracidiphilus sp.]
MTRRFRIAFHVILGLGYCGWARAQAAQVQLPVPQDHAEHAIADIKLGQSAVPLYGPWKFTVGDSPVDPTTHAPLWAQPGFDDSSWETVELAPKTEMFDPVGGYTGYVPGWQARGHAGYWGYAWYRMRMRLEVRPGEKIALAGPPDMDDGYQVFMNGTPLGSFGDFTGNTPATYYTQPMMFVLPEFARSDPGGSTQVVAFRVWMDATTPTYTPDAGGFHTAPVLGEAGAVTAGYQIRWLGLVRSYAPYVVGALLFGLLAAVAFSLILFDRSDRVYLWMGAVFLLQAVHYALGAFDTWTQHLSMQTNRLLRDDLLLPLINAGWVMVWWIWFGRQRPAWLPRAAGGMALLYMISNAIGEELFFGLVPHPAAAGFHVVSLSVRLLFFALLAWIVIQGIRREGLEGWLVLPAVALLGIGMFQDELAVLHIHMAWFPFGVKVALAQMAYLLLVGVLALLLFHRLLRSVHRQRLMALDVKQAQEVQQVILPEARTTLPGLVIESEYRPAREVGGDFFQILPHSTDGSLLIVAGDVTGKGLKAGMQVALLVGAIRTAAETNDEPQAMLGALNRRLMGRGDAQATCLAMRIAADGAVTLANAGHVAPYLNGEPLPIEGALPLGMIEGAESSVMRFHLELGDRLMLISDGIAEATDADGHLFGFERVHELLRSVESAAEVANAAQTFGQEDDISVISVTRIPVNEPALA